MRTLQAPRGMRDLLAADAAAFDALFDVVRARALRYGYPRIVTPIVEDREVFIRGAGATSDIVSYEMYEVGAEAGLVLRPEGTAAVTRAFLQAGLHVSPRPVRLFYWDPMFRGQRPQLLRYRQFWQWGLECFGEEGPGADVEMVEFTASLFAELGLVDQRLEVNTIGDAKCRAKVKEGLTAYFSAHRDALTAESQKRLETNVLRILDSKDERDRKVIAGAPPLADLLCDDDRAHFAAFTAGLDRLGIPYTVVPTLVRGLDYYTRTVFEFILTDPAFTKGSPIAVAGGGRYDGLVETMGGPAMAGVGIAGGVDVLLGALAQRKAPLPREPRAEVWIVSAEQDDAVDREQLAAPLREAGFAVAVELSRRSLDKQLESAAKHGAKVVIIRGTPEARGGNVVVRDLATGDQRVTRLAAVVTEVGRHAPRYPKPPFAGPES
ncbi:MAG TPA: histidine--tRNA ligase [Candidatus Limnocylindria bacterium]|nr:histidine--tRNA ligase [Candidatus Limnocylindria bacterium]